MALQTDKPALEDGFRETLSDCVELLKKLLPYVNTTQELLDVMVLGLENESQLRFLLKLALRNK